MHGEMVHTHTEENDIVLERVREELYGANDERGHYALYNEWFAFAQASPLWVV